MLKPPDVVKVGEPVVADAVDKVLRITTPEPPAQPVFRQMVPTTMPTAPST